MSPHVTRKAPMEPRKLAQYKGNCKLHLPIFSNLYMRLKFSLTLRVEKMPDWQNATECGTTTEKSLLFSCKVYWAVRSNSAFCFV